MKKAFFINGGAGRVLCSIPALERLAKTDGNFIVVTEGWHECFLGHPVLQSRTFPSTHKNLFEQHLRDCEIITPEPYRLNAYFNQKCNLIQAFDIIINGETDLSSCSKIKIELSKKEQIFGYNLVDEVRTVKQKEKVIVFQPFGSTAIVQGKFIFDGSGRSFELSDVYKIIESLTRNYGVILMSQIPLPNVPEIGIAYPQNIDIRGWMGIINAGDYFLGCDSVGQHISYALEKPTTVVIGSTFPENISYPNSKNFTIVDNGGESRKYSPIRITVDETTDRINENLMILSPTKINEIITSVNRALQVPNTTVIPTKLQPKIPNLNLKK